MNVVTILLDSLNRHNLEPYGAKICRTPRIREFVERGAVCFDNHFVGSLPCMPARRELFAGRYEFLWRGWGPLEPFDVPLPWILRGKGIKTAVVTDHYHYWEYRGNSYLQPFEGCEMIRGQELDFWKTDNRDDPEWVQSINRWRPGWGSIFHRNIADFRDECDFFAPKTMRAAVNWLDRNHNQGPFFLHIEEFSPHEAFYVPEPYRTMYTDTWHPEISCWPPYQDPQARKAWFAQSTPEQIEYIRSQYKGLVTMVDRWLGEVFSALTRHGLWENTMVILMADHGHDLGHRQMFGKQFPHYDSHANIPLIVWHPEYARDGRRIGALTQTVDIQATILEAMGLSPSQAGPDSRSLIPLLQNRSQTHRDWALYGTFGTGCCLTDGTYCLYQGADGTKPLNTYSANVMNAPVSGTVGGPFMPGIDVPVWKIPQKPRESFDSILVNRADGPFNPPNRIKEEPQVAARMRNQMIQVMQEVGCPPEQFVRLGLKKE